MPSLDPTKTYKAAIIGAGSGGLTLAIGLAGFGHDVVLIEGGDVGGDCTNVGNNGTSWKRGITFSFGSHLYILNTIKSGW